MLRNSFLQKMAPIFRKLIVLIAVFICLCMLFIKSNNTPFSKSAQKYGTEVVYTLQGFYQNQKATSQDGESTLPYDDQTVSTLDHKQTLDNANTYIHSNFNTTYIRTLLPTCQEEQDSFVYIKTHKCASDTMSVVFRRFGYRRNLTIVQPVGKRWNIGWPEDLKPYMFRASKSGKYHIITDHTILNTTYMDSLIPGCKYITSIRHPFEFFKSSFSYFGVAKSSGIAYKYPNEDHVEMFLRNLSVWEDDKVYARTGWPNTVHNLMSFDLGLPTGYHNRSVDYHESIEHIQEWLRSLDEKFSLVMIVEYFHESLVLLRRVMCWSTKDVLYHRYNTGRRKNKTAVYPPELVDKYMRWSLADSMLYYHFNRTFWQTIDLMGREDFMAEVDSFNQIMDETTSYCRGHGSPGTLAPKRIAATRWSAAFELTAADCRMIASTSGMREELRQRYDADPRAVQQPPPPPGKRIPGL